MKLEDITIATADKFLQTYRTKLLPDYGEWWLTQFRPDYAVANGIFHARVPSREVIKRYSEGHVPKSVTGIDRLEAAGITFPITPAQRVFLELSNLAALVYFTGYLREGRSYAPTISPSRLIDYETIADLLPSFPLIMAPANSSGTVEIVRTRHLLSPLGRVLYAMGIEPGRKLDHEAGFPEYILNLARLARSPEPSLPSPEDRLHLKRICYSFAQIFFSSKGDKTNNALRLRISASAGKRTAKRVGEQAQQFLHDLFNISTHGGVEKRETILVSGERREVYTPLIYIKGRELEWLFTEYGNAGHGVVDLSKFVPREWRLQQEAKQ